jgi:hypothetical protein
VASTANAAIDPSTGALYFAFSDNRNGTHDVDEPVTNTDVFVTSSMDGGATWTTPTQVDTNTGDEWFPWIDINPLTGTLGIVYHTRNDLDPDLYNTAVAVGLPGAFSVMQVSSKPSDPTRSFFFRAGEPPCFFCSTFMGDYNRMAFGPDGTAHVVWTDMRRELQNVQNPPKHLQFIFYRSLPDGG